MNAIRTAGVVVAAGLLVGCQQKNDQARAAAREPASIQASESLRQSLVRANPDARVGIVAATVGRFAAVRDVPAGNVAEGASVQILDPAGEVVGYGLVRAVKDDTIHVLYQSDTRRGPSIGDLVMPATDAGVPMEEMPAGAGMEPAAETTEPSLLPPRRQAAQPDAAPAEAAPAEAVPAEQPVAQPQEPAPSLKEEAQPGEFQPAPGGNKAALPPVEGATDAAAPGATEPAPEKAAEPSPGDTNNTAGEAAPSEKAADAPAPDAAAQEAPAPEAAKEPAPAPAAEEKAPEADKPGLNK